MNNSFVGRMRGARLCSTATAQSGVGLIEVLVAVLVLSIGFLGMAALQALSLSTNNSAMARSMAVVSSYSILDAMRADSANAKAGQYNATVVANECPDAAGSLAKWQLNHWCAQLSGYFGPTGDTKGKVNCTTLGICTVQVIFDDSRAGNGGVNGQTIITQAML